MARGRKPKPDHLRVLEGYADKKAMDLKTPEAPPLEEVTCPDYLDGYAKECWDNLAPRMAKKGWLSALDQPLFELFCQYYGEYRTAAEALKAKVRDDDPSDGLTYWSYGRNGRMIRTKPLVAIKAQAAREMKGLAAEFGLSPAARMRLRGSDQGDFFDDLDGALGG